VDANYPIWYAQIVTRDREERRRKRKREGKSKISKEKELRMSRRL